MSVRTRTIILVGAMLSIPAGLVAADDPLLGTWKQIGIKPPHRIVRKHVPVPGGIQVLRDGVGEDGKPFHAETTARFDGKDYPYQGDHVVDAITLKRLSPHTIEGLSKKGGKVIGHFRWEISGDGKLFTWVAKYPGPPETSVVQVFEKVSDQWE